MHCVAVPRDMLAVGVRNVVLARGMLDKLEGPKYAERRAELRRKAREAARARDRQTTAASQNEAEESDESGEETAGRRENDESGKNARWHEGRCENRVLPSLPWVVCFLSFFFSSTALTAQCSRYTLHTCSSCTLPSGESLPACLLPVCVSRFVANERTRYTHVCVSTPA